MPLPTPPNGKDLYEVSLLLCEHQAVLVCVFGGAGGVQKQNTQIRRDCLVAFPTRRPQLHSGS